MGGRGAGTDSYRECNGDIFSEKEQGLGVKTPKEARHHLLPLLVAPQSPLIQGTPEELGTRVHTLLIMVIAI